MYKFNRFVHNIPKGRRMPLNINAKEIWLTYFNKVLFEKGLISEKEKTKMTNLIYRESHSSNYNKEILKSLRERNAP